jgi:DNA-binding YbaB/EbfC family protein
MKGPLAKLMQQAQEMQEKMQQAQAELAQAEVTGQAGGGLVRVTLNGQHQVKKIHIDHDTIGDDREMLEDLLIAAFNDATNKIAQLQQDNMANMAGGMGLPPGFKLPF